MSLFGNYGFYKSDRIAIAIFVTIVVCCALVMYFAGKVDNDIFVDGGDARKESVSYGNSLEVRTGDGDSYYYVEGRKARLFPFDPNTADSTQLLSLGLQPWMVRNIYKYRAAGGVYRKPADFARLYGLTLKQYKMLEPFIRIHDDYKPASEFYPHDGNTFAYEESSQPVARDTLKYPYKLRRGETMQVNTADTTQLKKIPGIGSAYAQAIVRWREKLGGFYSASQLREIDGFPEEAMPYVKVDASGIRKLKVNELTYRQLRQHPYLNYYQARDIVDFRRIHGTLKSMSQLELMESFTAEDISRLRHYLEF